jgi:hypothetical protein
MPVRIGTNKKAPTPLPEAYTPPPTPPVPDFVAPVLVPHPIPVTPENYRFTGSPPKLDNNGFINNPPTHGWLTQPTIWYRRALRTFLFDLRAP